MPHQHQNCSELDQVNFTSEVPPGSHEGSKNRRDASYSMTPIQSVPDDVLAYIFEAVTLIPGTLFNDLPFPHLVASISRRWRTVALSSPRLWTTIVFDYRGRRGNQKCPSLWIERSGACLLDITIFVGLFSHNSDVQSAMDQIIPHIGRWHWFTVETLPQSMLETVVPRLRTASAPYLRHFDMTVNQDIFEIAGYIPSICGHIFTGGAASLASARILGLCYMYTPPLGGLTFLQFGGRCEPTSTVLVTAEDLRDLLTAATSIIHLALQCLDIVFPSNSTISDIQIPSLRSLSVNLAYCGPSFLRLVSLLSLPNLETLNLAHMSRAHVQFIDPGAQRYAALRTLKIFYCRAVLPSLSKSLFTSFPSITHLYLIESSESVLAQSDGDLAIAWPLLKFITFSNPVSTSLICNFIDTRKEMGHPLTTIYVPRLLLTSSEAAWSRVRQEIEVLEVDDAESLQYPGGRLLDVELESGSEDEAEDDYDYEDEDYYDDYGRDFEDWSRANSP